MDINETDTELYHEDAYRFRSIAARLNFLAADRIDIQFANKEMQANVEPMHVGLGQGSKAGEILAEAHQTGAVVCMAGCPVQPPGVRRHRLRWVPAHTEVHQWRSGHAREPLVEDLGFDTDRGGALKQ